MKRYPLRQLVDVRDLRARLALDTVRGKQAAEAKARERVAAETAALDALLDSRRRQQRQLADNAGRHLDATALELCDRRIALLADQAGEAANAVQRATQAEREATAEVETALSAYRRALAKHDALDTCQQRWVGDQRRLAVRGEEVVMDEFVQAQFERRKA
ncbi:MAG: YscO family type III secretion system apparatus protein [Pseudomonadota bacterium]